MSTSNLQLTVRGGSAAAAAAVRAPRAISPTAGVANRTIFWEALAVCALVLGVALFLPPRDAGLRRPGPHLVWIAVLLVAARYGTRGLSLALPISAAALAATARLLGQMPALEQRLAGSADLLALVAAVLVAWVASTHENRCRQLASDLEAAKNRSLGDRKTAGEMRDMLVALRSRADRMNLSLTFLRNVAQRLEGRDPEEAAAAALALAMTCLEARAGVIKLSRPMRGGAQNDDIMPGLLSYAGPWNGKGSAPTLEGDHVVEAALGTGEPVNASDLGGVCLGDADMAAPLLDRQGRPFGVLAVRGLPHRAAGAMALRDLTVVSEWLANVLTPRQQLEAIAPAQAAEDDHRRRPYIELNCSSDLDIQPRSSEVQA
jgi:hypothetical protein